jgi:2-(1,2-epoxy-1,2-dihydrophenyl)acetyl-CoA isomerase
VGLDELVDDDGGSARMTNGPVLYQQRGGIATLTLNRPESLNAMNEAMMGELERILIALEADPAVRAVVLTGAGRAFSSGGDQKRGGVEVPSSFFDGDPGGTLIERLNRCILRMQRLPKPIVGSINGVAAGAGLNIALATDLRIASDTARFGEVFARVGLVPDGGGTYFLPRLVGTAKAMELIMLADLVDAQEAVRIGLVNRVVPAEQLAQETHKLVERLAQGPTVAYGLAKTGLYQGLGMSLEDVLDMEARNQAIAARTPDRAEGVAAFLEKRPPRFTGCAGAAAAGPLPA